MLSISHKNITDIFYIIIASLQVKFQIYAINNSGGDLQCKIVIILSY
jgi:hypothetical protein